ncbi:MAG: hypothetical protein GY832_24495 [Chloroflexi bacterium]|nr:hypothetical protein [Chloroflexota bacterium]
MTFSAQYLDHLEISGLVRLAQTAPELEYLFRHALVQEAAYKSLLRQDRKRMHRAVGETLERLYPDRLDELASLLAHHFAVAGDDQRALEYYILAGDTVARAYANDEAVEHYTRALEIARRLPATELLAIKGDAEPVDPIQHLYTRRGRVLELGGQYDKALANYAEMETLARQRGDRPLELAALMACATIYSTPTAKYDPAQAQPIGNQALTLARELGEHQVEAKLLWLLILLELYGGYDCTAGIEYGEQSATLARKFNLHEQLAFTLNDLSRAYRIGSNSERSWAALTEARDLWRELDNLPMLVDTLASFVLLHYHDGEYEQALENYQAALRISRSIGNLWGQSHSLMWGSLVYYERGDPGKAIEGLEQAIHLGEQAGFVGPLVATRASLAMIYGDLGAVERGLELANLAIAAAEAHIPVWRPWAFAVLARLYLLAGDIAQAETTVKEGFADAKQLGLLSFAIFLAPLAEAQLALAQGDHAHAITVMDELSALLRKNSMRAYLPDALYLKGKALLAQNQVDKAHEVLAEACAVAETIGSRRSLWSILFTLSQIEAARGNTAEAANLRQQAQEVIEYIADHAGTPELRTLFLDLADVRAVLDSG